MRSNYRNILLTQIQELKEEINKESVTTKLTGFDLNKINELRERLLTLTLELSDIKHWF